MINFIVLLCSCP